MTRIFLLSAALIAAIGIKHAEAASGYTTSTINVEHRDVPLEIHLWYPSQEDGTTLRLGKNAVFKGVDVLQDATPEPGAHPFVVLSHGSGGNAANLAWIAAELAERGMVVAATNHPGTTSRDSIQAETVRVWERPADLGAIVDHALDGGFAQIAIDPKNIGAVGFSLGGHSVLGLAGARVSKAAFVDYCERYGGMLDCGWLAAGGVDFTQIDAGPYEQSNLDPRVTAVVAIDPALSQAYVAKSLNAIDIPVQLINLGVGAEVPAAIDAANLVADMGNGQLVQVSGASHYSFLGDCTFKGAMIIKASGEDAICSETGDRSRADIHTELKTTIGDFLATHLVAGDPS